MTRIEIIEAIQASTPEDKVSILSLLNYSFSPVTADLVANDIPSWQNVLDKNLAPANSIVIALGATLTSSYIAIDYTPYIAYGNVPTILVQQVESDTINTDIYDVPVKRIFVAGILTTLNVYAHDNGSGLTLDTIQLIIKL